MAHKKLSQQKKYHHGDLKQALLDETARILKEEGDSALSLRRLASNLGVSRTAPYNHFANKEALLLAVAEEGFKRFKRAMKAARNNHTGNNGLQYVQTMVQAYLNFAMQNPQYYDLMYSKASWGAGNPSESLSLIARRTLT